MDDFDDITCEEFYDDTYVPDPDSAYDDQFEVDFDYN